MWNNYQYQSITLTILLPHKDRKSVSVAAHNLNFRMMMKVGFPMQWIHPIHLPNICVQAKNRTVKILLLNFKLNCVLYSEMSDFNLMNFLIDKEDPKLKQEVSKIILVYKYSFNNLLQFSSLLGCTIKVGTWNSKKIGYVALSVFSCIF